MASQVSSHNLFTRLRAQQPSTARPRPPTVPAAPPCEDNDSEDASLFSFRTKEAAEMVRMCSGTPEPIGASARKQGTPTTAPTVPGAAFSATMTPSAASAPGVYNSTAAAATMPMPSASQAPYAIATSCAPSAVATASEPANSPAQASHSTVASSAANAPAATSTGTPAACSTQAAVPEATIASATQAAAAPAPATEEPMVSASAAATSAPMEVEASAPATTASAPVASASPSEAPAAAASAPANAEPSTSAAANAATAANGVASTSAPAAGAPSKRISPRHSRKQKSPHAAPISSYTPSTTRETSAATTEEPTTTTATNPALKATPIIAKASAAKAGAKGAASKAAGGSKGNRANSPAAANGSRRSPAQIKAGRRHGSPMRTKAKASTGVCVTGGGCQSPGDDGAGDGCSPSDGGGVSDGPSAPNSPPGSPPAELDVAKFVDEEGNVRIWCNGLLGLFDTDSQQVTCGCEACGRLGSGGPMTATEFERHAGMASSKKWRRSLKIGDYDTDYPLGKWLEDQGLSGKASKASTPCPTQDNSAHSGNSGPSFANGFASGRQNSGSVTSRGGSGGVTGGVTSRGGVTGGVTRGTGVTGRGPAGPSRLRRATHNSGSGFDEGGPGFSAAEAAAAEAAAAADAAEAQVYNNAMGADGMMNANAANGVMNANGANADGSEGGEGAQVPEDASAAELLLFLGRAPSGGPSSEDEEAAFGDDDYDHGYGGFGGGFGAGYGGGFGGNAGNGNVSDAGRSVRERKRPGWLNETVDPSDTAAMQRAAQDTSERRNGKSSRRGSTPTPNTGANNTNATQQAHSDGNGATPAHSGYNTRYGGGSAKGAYGGAGGLAGSDFFAGVGTGGGLGNAGGQGISGNGISGGLGNGYGTNGIGCSNGGLGGAGGGMGSGPQGNGRSSGSKRRHGDDHNNESGHSSGSGDEGRHSPGDNGVTSRRPSPDVYASHGRGDSNGCCGSGKEHGRLQQGKMHQGGVGGELGKVQPSSVGGEQQGAAAVGGNEAQNGDNVADASPRKRLKSNNGAAVAVAQADMKPIERSGSNVAATANGGGGATASVGGATANGGAEAGVMDLLMGGGPYDVPVDLSPAALAAVAGEAAQPTLNPAAIAADSPAATAVDDEGDVQMGDARPYVYRWGDRGMNGATAATAGVNGAAAASAAGAANGAGVANGAANGVANVNEAGGLFVMLRWQGVRFSGVLSPVVEADAVPMEQ